MIEFKKPEGFKYLSTLNPYKNELKIEYKNYINDDDSTNEKVKELKNPFSLSGSKAKKIIMFPRERYEEVILGKNVYFNKDMEIRMKWGIITEAMIIYHFINPEYENNPLWKDKLIVIDKRRRYVKDMPWISYELDMIVYKLDKPRNEYGEGYSTGNFIDCDGKKVLTYYKNDFVIDNSFGAYDKFLSLQEKYAIYDIKNSQLDVIENFDNYIYQINLCGYFENVQRVGIFNMYKNSKLEELVKNIDARIITKIFNGYDNFIKGLETGYTFEKELNDGICTEIPLETDKEDNKKILDKIYYGFELLSKYNDNYKKSELELKLIKDYIKMNLPVITKKENYNIVIPLSNNEKITYYTTKKTIKKEIDTKELIKFINNNDIILVKNREGKEINFDLNNFMYEKITGGIGMFRILTNTKIEIDSQIEKNFKGEEYEI